MMKANIYKVFDLSFLSVLTLVTGIASIKLGMEFITSGYYLSFAHLFVMIAMLRWGYSGIWVSIVAIIPDLIFSNSSLQLAAYLILSNVGLFVLVYLSKKITISKINQQTSLLIGFAVSYFALLIFGRGLFSFVIGLPFQTAMNQSFIQLIFSILMSVIALLMAKNIEGVLLDMNTILSRGDV